MNQINSLSNHLCPHMVKEDQNNLDASLNSGKPKKYHHLKNMKQVKSALVDSSKLEGMIPRLRMSDEVLNMIPEEIKNHVVNLRQWAVFHDGDYHKTLRRSFPTEFMVYKVTKANNTKMLEVAIDKLLAQSAQNNPKIINVQEELSIPLSVVILCKVLGFKQVTSELEKKLHLWAERSSDTGQRYPFDENAKYYMESHQFFLKTIEEIEKAIQNNDESKYDLSGLIGKMIQGKIITDKSVMANQCQMWVLGGSHNPANLCSLSIGFLLSHDEQFQKLRQMIKENPQLSRDLMHMVTNEVLRHSPPAHVIVRFSNCPMAIDNNEIKKGDGIILHLEQASRNQEGIENPQVFNIFRQNKDSSHLGFGFGPHRCMGGETGQLCAEILMEKLLFNDLIQNKSEFSNIRLKKFEWVVSGSFKEIKEISLTF